jgi:cytochrome b561
MTSAASVHPAAPAKAAVPERHYAIRQYRTPAKVFHWLTALLIVFMVCSGVIAKQLSDGAVADMLFSLHKMTGALTLCVIVLRLAYRLVRSLPSRDDQPRTRPLLHWTLYGVVMLVPLLGWAGISDFGAREIFPGYSLPAIWPEGAGYDALLLQWHAYFAFGLLALIALHIGVAIQDYMTADRPPPEDE